MFLRADNAYGHIVRESIDISAGSRTPAVGGPQFGPKGTTLRVLSLLGGPVRWVLGAVVEKGVISMTDIRMLTVAAALVLVAAACANDAADTTQPVLSPVTVPSTTTVTTGAAGGEDETTDGDTTTTQATEAPDETTDGDTTTTEATEAPDETTEDVTVEPVEGETGDASPEPQPDDQTQPLEEPDEPQPDRVVVWEGVVSEDKCVVAGGVWSHTECEYWVFEDPADAARASYWHPRLMDDAYHAVDPETVDADHSESFDTRGPWGIHNYHVFYHYNSLGDAQVQYESMREAMRYGVRSVFVPLTDWVWFPYRYDVSWSDVPNVVAVRGTYPLGEQRTLLVPLDPQQRGAPNIEMPLPLPPPIRPTTPFTQPLWDHLPEGLGRDCPPVEEIWNGYGTEVTDPCTLKAVETAVDWMWRDNADWRWSAIRDGQAMIDFLLELESFEDPYENALLGYESRVGGAILVRDVKWAGQWPGASMISIEWNLNYPWRDYTPEEKEAKDRYIAALIDLGYELSEDYLRDDMTLGEEFWNWAEALIVRTQDGTWRMSQRSFCWWYEKVIRIDQEKLLCPEDPNPHFPDSAWFDHDIYPPSHKNYYQDPRASRSLQSLPHHDRGAPRRTGEYLGVPPS